MSDTFNGVGLLIGGLLVTIFSLNYAGTFTGIENPSVFQTLGKIKEHDPEIFNSLGSPTDDASWPTLFTGVLLLNFFYWTTNQQIIQRTFGAKNLAEGQKGVLAAAFFKILAPLILVIPGIVAVYIAANSPEFRAELLDDNGEVDNNNVYGTLVKTVLKSDWLIGFFAAVVVGSILSTFNSVLNSSATLFSLGIYKRNINPDATTEQVVKSGRMVSLIVGLFAVIAAPLIFMGREKGLFGYFQALNGIYFIPDSRDCDGWDVQPYGEWQSRADYRDNGACPHDHRHVLRRRLGHGNVWQGLPLHGSSFCLLGCPPARTWNHHEARRALHSARFESGRSHALEISKAGRVWI